MKFRAGQFQEVAAGRQSDSPELTGADYPGSRLRDMTPGVMWPPPLNTPERASIYHQVLLSAIWTITIKDSVVSARPAHPPFIDLL